jgi:sulfite exporter TauE/SafE
MCGSIIGTLTLSLKPEIRNNKKSLFQFVLNYNIGRIFSYATAGGLVGLAQMLITLPFAAEYGHRMLQLFSAFIVMSAGFYIGGWFPRFAYIEKSGVHLWRIIEPYGRRLIPVKTRLQALLFGMVWGWLPCGLVYTALALAATTGNILNSAMTMLAFGLGTLPAIVGAGIMTGTLAKLAGTQRFKQFIGLILVMIGLIAVFPWLNPMHLQSI